MSTQSSDNNKRIAKNTLLLYFRMLFMMAVALYTSRVVLNTLGVEDYGIYNVVGGVVAMFGFINGSMSSATQRYITFALGKGDKDRLQTVFSTTLQIHTMIAGIIILLGETVGLWFLYNKMQIPADRMDAAFWVLQCSIISTVVMIISVPYNADIVAHEKMSAFAYISVLEVVLKLAIVYMLVIFSFDKLVLYAFLILAVQVLIRFCYSIYCNKHFEETKYKHVWDKALFKEMTGFAGWSLFGNIASVLTNTGVNLLLNMFFGPVVNAARGVAVQVQSAINNFATNFQMALNPQITKSYAKGNLLEMYRLIERSSRFSFFLLYILSTPILLLTADILTVWLKIVPEHTVAFLRIILLIVMIDSIANPIMVAASATGKVRRYQSIVGSVILLIAPIAYVALKLGATPEVVFVVHLVICALAFITRLLIVRPMIQLPIRKYTLSLLKKIVPVVIVSFPLSYGICKFIIHDAFVLLVADGLLCVMICSLSVFFLGLEKRERSVVLNKISEKNKKVKMGKGPLVSIIVPVYNREKTIQACIKSILDSELKDFEILLIDDGSTDATGRVCEQLAAHDKRVVFVRKVNEGVSVARNVGLSMAKGDWITFVDSDDAILPCHLNVLLQKQIDSVDLVMTGHVSGSIKNGKVTPSLGNIGSINDVVVSSNAAAYLFNDFKPFKNPIYPIWNKFFKRNIICEKGILFDSTMSLGEDQVFLCEYLQYAKGIAHFKMKSFVNLAWPGLDHLGTKLRTPSDYLYNQKKNYKALCGIIKNGGGQNGIICDKLWY